MTKNRIMRFALSLALIVIAIMCFATKGTQKVNTVKADTTIGPVTVVTEFEYNSDTVEDYVYMFKQGWLDIYNTLNPTFVSEGGKITKIVIYEWDDNLGDWYEILNTGADIDDSSDDIGDTNANMLPMYSYGVQYYWYSSGSYGAGYSGEDPIEITVTPKSIDHMYDSWQFDNCHYSDTDWEFKDDSWFDRQHNWNWENDDVYLNWFYMDGDEEVMVNETTHAGTYFIYPKLTGAHAERYTIGTLEYNDMMMGMTYITKDTPVEFTIEKKAIQPTVRYLGTTDLTMTLETDADSINEIYYNGILQLDVYYAGDPNINITIDKWRDTVEFEAYTDGISEIGTYFVKTANFILDEESARDYTISSTKCNVKIKKRTVEANIDWNAYYTGEEVVPVYYITPYLSMGETADMVMKPDLMVNDMASTLVYEYGSNGHVVYDLIDTDHFEIYDTMNGLLTTSVEADYYVDKGYADIDFEQIAPWHYREFVANRDELAEKLTITTTTSDPDEEVTISKIEWTVEANIDIYTIWTDFDYQAPNQYDLIWMESGVAFRITTTESTNGKFRETEAIYRFALEKAPVYVRVVNTDLTYNGEGQSPEYDNYRFYIYAPDIDTNIWSDQTGLANLDELLEFYDGHLFTWEGYNVNAGTYNLKVSLVPAQEEFYTLMINDAEFDGTIVDPDAVYVIKKAPLNVTEYEIDDMLYGQGLYVQPHITVTGLIDGDEYDYEVDNETWYYNMDSCYVNDEDWISIDELPAIPHAGYYYIKYVAEFANYETLTIYGYGDNYNLKINKREVEIKWYANENDALTDPGSGLITNNETTMYVATYTYDSYVQMPVWLIFDSMDFDNLEATWRVRTKEGTIVESPVDAGLYYVELYGFDSDDYLFPNKYQTCIAMFEIEKATLTVTPDADQSKTFGDADPEFTYAVTGIKGTDKPIIEGSVARTAGATVGTYAYNVGSLYLPNNDINNNYELEFVAPYTFAITPKTITATFSSTEKIYTSKPLTPDFDAFVGLETGYTNVDIKYVGGNTINAGSYTKQFELAPGGDSANYVLESTAVQFTILRYTIGYTTKIDDQAVNSVQFTGNLHVLSVIVTDKPAGTTDDVYITILTNGEGTDVGDYNAHLALAGESAVNYQFADGEEYHTWKITKAGFDYTKFSTAFEGYKVAYDGDAHTVRQVKTIPTGYSFEYYETDVDHNFTNTVFAGKTHVGKYYVEVRFTPESGYDDVDSLYLVIEIEKKEITINWVTTVYTYDGTAHLPTYTLSGVVGNENVNVILDTDGVVNKSTTTVTATINEADYVLTGNTQCTLIINAREVTITGNDFTSIYGSVPANFEPDVTVTDGTIIEGDTDVYKVACDVETNTPVGTYTVRVSKGSNKNYDVTVVDGTYKINKRKVTITADAKESIYGNALVTLTAQVTAGELVGNDTIAKLVTITTNATPTSLVADNYLISVEDKGNANYDITTVNAFYAITKRVITVTIADKTSVYGDDIKTLTAKVTEGDLFDGVNPYELECDVLKTTPVGTYAITGTVKNKNYDITFVDGTYTITKREITVTIDKKTSVYGDDIVKLTASKTDGSFVNDDKDSKVYVVKCDIDTTTGVGSYLIYGETINNNYDVTYETANYVITKRAITVTINNSESTYGDPRAELTAKVTVGEIVNNDVNVYGLDAVIGTTTAIGEYDITGKTLNNNYDITFVNGVYTVNPRPITVTIDDKTSVYGNDLVLLTHAVTSDIQIVNGDNVYTVASEVTSTSNVGEYAITGTATNDNYTVTFVNGTYTLTKREITITIFDETSVYGDLIVPFVNDITAGTIVEGDNPYTVACLNGEVAINNATPVGEYDIVGTCTDDNYDITFVNGTYTITKRAITVTADEQTSVYGDAIANLTSKVTAGNIVNGDDVYTFTTTALTTSAVGTYPITGRAYNDNYDVTFVNATYTVTKRAITVTIADKTSIYGDDVVAVSSTVTAGNIVNADNVYTIACEVTSAHNVGEYAITHNVTNDNYDVTFVDGKYTITAREVVLTWTNDEFVYDEAAHKPVATAGNLANNDIVTVTVTGEKVVAGTYTATATALSNANYVLPANVNHNFLITKPTNYNKPIDTKLAQSTGVDLTEVFDNIDTTSQNATLDLNIDGATVTFDKATIDAIAAADNAVLKFNYVEGDASKDIYKKAVAVFEITLDGATFENGTVTVTREFVNNAPFGKVAKVYYIDGNKKVDMKATFADDTVTFTTNHFSTYAVVYTLSTLSIILIIVAIVVVLGVGGFCVFKFVIKKNK